MKVINKEEFLNDKEFFLNEMRTGKIFVYPTDTIYGIGCDACNSGSVKRMRELKKRDEKPFSVIAPSKKWIEENCVVDEKIRKWLEKLPGKYTFILDLRNWECVSNEVNFGADTIGTRIPKNWFSEIVSEFGKPFVTTSVNLSGERFMISLENMDKDVKEKVDYIIYTGELNRKPSTLVNLSEKEEKIIAR